MIGRRVRRLRSGRARRRPGGGAIAPLLIGLVVLASACGGTSSPSAPLSGPTEPLSRWSNEATVDLDAAEVRVQLCAEEGHARALRFEHGTAPVTRVVWSSREQSAAIPIEGSDETIDVDLGPGDCVRYVIALDRLRPEHATRYGDALLLHTDAWLAEPAPRSDDPRATLEMRLAGAGDADTDVVTPFPRRDGVAMLDASAMGFPSVTMARPARVRSTRIAGTPTQLVVATDGLDDVPLEAWLEAHGRAVSTLFRQLPVPRLTVFVVPADDADEPVAFARTLRGGGAMLVAHVSEDATREQLVSRDWVAIHELTHVGLPYVREEDAWLSEGITTYYQEVLRARAGLQSEQRAWERLVDGFRRGREQASGRTLREATAALPETRDYERVYWGGAALMLELDVALRRAHGWGLDRVARAWSRCCAWPPTDASAEELITRAATQLDAPRIREIVERRLDAEEPLAIDDTLERLGVEVGPDGEVRLLDDAPAADVRRAITRADGQG